jgi:hypothetical protein
MIRGVTATLALIAFCSPASAQFQCPQPVYGQNWVCLDPEGPVTSPTPTIRSRTFAMNGRTTDSAQPNIFWVVAGQWSAGNWGSPKIRIIEYSAPGVSKYTQAEFSVSGSYGTQQHEAERSGLFDVFVYFLNVNFNDIDVRGGQVRPRMPCSVGLAQSIQSGTLIARDSSNWNGLDDVVFIRLASYGGGQGWVSC